MKSQALAALCVLVASCGSAARLPPPDPSAPISAADFNQDATFCAVPPAKGRIRYVVSGRRVTLQLTVTGLAPATDLSVEWHNAHSPRGYTIAAFRTDASGTPKRQTLRMFRAGETRASIMALATNADFVAARLLPCR